MRKLFLTLCFQLFLLLAFAQSFSLGQRVEGYNSGEWYKGTVTQIGSGNYQGYYYIQWEKYTVGQWVKAENVRAVKTAAAAAATSPRAGEYVILSYSSQTNPLRIGYFTLSNGTYTYYNLAKKQIGQGAYTYNTNTKTVQWTSGPFKETAWGGQFEIDREGKTHKIRLNRVTIGSNSTDSK
ncbi:hypothetical protein [Flavisolibacter ginsenosidimutans]|uniref:Uncharacterized protein n=1 Tax=Flavisolibacter ginsenosidimutans TaxID=661481 RepID=A0A5B8UI56_9BACT|nr:hypothetical protein [Flavisolibacter ginsenosidimutans]QEC56046.1 hypothetical protein FSB75_09120 [Flavisolibacter ginsenosidimutans]